jgi:hypothetical protein
VGRIRHERVIPRQLSPGHSSRSVLSSITKIILSGSTFDLMTLTPFGHLRRFANLSASVGNGSLSSCAISLPYLCFIFSIPLQLVMMIKQSNGTSFKCL